MNPHSGGCGEVGAMGRAGGEAGAAILTPLFFPSQQIRRSLRQPCHW